MFTCLVDGKKYSKQNFKYKVEVFCKLSYKKLNVTKDLQE